MIISFTKMNGAGNDFVVLDNRDLAYSLTKEQIAHLCDRHRGVGADGLLAAEPSEGEADFRFRYYNADGGEAEMCGNGARCFGRFTASLLPTEAEVISFETIAGVLSAKIVDSDIEVAMSDPFDITMETPVEIEGLTGPVRSMNTGVPHAVAFVEDLEEDETLACGTGMVACALFHHLLTGAPSPIKVDVKGGVTLEIGFAKEGEKFTNVTLTGPAEVTFTGEIEI